MSTPESVDHPAHPAPASALGPASPRNEARAEQVYGQIKLIAVAVVGALVIGLVIAMLVQSNRKAEAQKRAIAYALFDGALAANDDPYADAAKVADGAKKRQEALNKVLSLYPDSPAAGDSAFLLAQTEFDLGHYDVAATKFADYAAKHADRQPLAGLALLGQGNSLLAQGKADDALAIFRMAANPLLTKTSPAIATAANFQGAICALSKGDNEAAKGMLSAVLASGAEPSVTYRAQALLTRINLLAPASAAPSSAVPGSAAPVPAPVPVAPKS